VTASPPSPFERIAVVGPTGCGKTTLSKALAERLAIPHIELDKFFWDPNWEIAPLEVFRARVAPAVAAPIWIADGNYSRVRDLVWTRATTLVWLDYHRPLIFWRLARRTIHRLITRERLWNNNREGLSDFFKPSSLFQWVFRRHTRHHHEYPKLLATPPYAHLHLVRLRTPKETEDWLETVPASHKN
jgi:adenylate kinase family enzyme